MATVAECFSLRSSQEKFLFSLSVFVTAVVRVAGYTGYVTRRIEGHINRYTHGGDYMQGMRKASGCFVEITMAGDTYFIGFVSKGNMAFVERQPRMAVITINIIAFIMYGICDVKGEQGE
jgi:hypothetical protein